VIRVLVIHCETAAASERASRLRTDGFEAEPYLSLGSKGFEKAGRLRAARPRFSD
jgi:hypothetical protein